MQASPIRLGIIGTNFISDRLCAAAKTIPREVTVCAVYSRRRETGEAFAAKHGIPHIFTEYEAFVSFPEMDAVYVASPNHAHGWQTVGALAKGKHVLCEKPSASNGKELSEMIRAAKEKKLVLLEAMRPSFDPRMDVIRSLLPEIGTLRRVGLDYCQYSSRYDPFKNGVILNAFDPSLSNAAIMDIGVYVVHSAARLFGRPRRILSMSTLLSNGFEGAGHVLLDYGEMKVELSYSKITHSVNPCFLMGEEGSITFKQMNSPYDIVLHRRGQAPVPIESPEVDNNMAHELRAFVSLVRSGTYDHPYLEDSVITMEIIDEVRRQNGIVFDADLRVAAPRA